MWLRFLPGRGRFELGVDRLARPLWLPRVDKQPQAVNGFHNASAARHDAAAAQIRHGAHYEA